MQMLGAIRFVKEKLGQGGHPVFSIQQKFPNPNGQGRTARFAGNKHLPAVGP